MSTATRTRRTVKRVLLGLAGVVVALPLLIIAYQTAIDSGSDQRGRTTNAVENSAAKAETVARGAYLARAGNCIGCHTTRGGQPYAGGRAIVTPFGDIFASNITPDAETGIGRWNADDFWRALHNGKSKDGHFLYPAFPYPSYTQVSRDDADALYAFLRTIPPVRKLNREHRLAFPYNQRIVLAFWRALYFKPGEYQPEVHKTAEWNRGAYLVQGLGHCAACHTPRDALGGGIAGRDFAGGVIPALNWHAPPLNGGTHALGRWSENDIAELLATGVSQRGAVFGPMAEVVANSLQYLNAPDLQAMAVYLKSLPPAGSEPSLSPAPDERSEEEKAVLTRGAKLYEQHCASCHGDDGMGVPPGYPALKDHASLTDENPLNAVRMVLNGGFPPGTQGNPRPYGMPPFGPQLSDDEVAAVLSYVREQWGRQRSLVSTNEVRRAGGLAGD